MRFGEAGENLAAAYLRRKGCVLLGRNVHVGRMGELDLIVRDAGTFVFVEVKARHSDRFGTPEDALTPAKRLHFSRAIHGWLLARGLADAPFRADVIAADWSVEPPTIRHHRGVEL